MRSVFQPVRSLPPIMLLVFFLAGCTTSDNPVGDDGDALASADLFPFGLGRTWVFSAYELDTLNSQKVPGTEHRQVTYVQGSAVIGLKGGWRTIDSTYFTDGSLASLDTTYYALEHGNLLAFTGTTWLTILDKSKGLDNEYEAGQFQYSVFGIPINVTVKAIIRARANMTVPFGSVRAFKLEVKYLTNFGGQVLEVLNHFYFADGIGPVRIVEPVQFDPIAGKKVRGNEAVLVSKNF
jgi:hypothetical protein